MIELKICCDCGQKYKFDVEPVNGQMPFTVACPICKRDGTAKANQTLQQMTVFKPVDPVPTPVVHAPTALPPLPTQPAAPVSPGTIAPPRAASPLAPAPVTRRIAPLGKRSENESEGEKWKWWYFILAGLCIGGYSIWQAYDQHRVKPLGSLFLAVFCIAIGIWDFQNKRKKKQAGK